MYTYLQTIIYFLHLLPKSLAVTTVSWTWPINDVIPANDKQRKNKAHKTRPMPPTYANNAGILSIKKIVE